MDRHQREFAEGILLGYMPIKAAERAGYSHPDLTAEAYEGAPEWQEVRDWVSSRFGSEEWKSLVASQEIFEHLLYRIRFDPRTLFNDRNEPLPITKMSRRDAACIEQIEYSTFQQGEQSGEKIKIKLAKRDKAIEILGKAVKFFEDNGVEINVHGEYQAAAEQLEGIFTRIRERQALELARAAEAEEAAKKPPGR